MFYDYHMHSYHSADSTAPMEEMIKSSINKGLKEICFTDHVDYDIIGNPNVKVNYEEYFKEIDSLSRKYADGISIKTGIEMGYQNHLKDRCSQDIQNHDFDFVIASIHTIDKHELYTGDYHKGKTQYEAYEGYYERLLDLVNTFNDYSVLGHIDLIKRYGGYPAILSDDLFSDYLEAILKKVIECGKGIELNTSCFRYNLPDLTPSQNILKLYKQLGGEIITVGSDSHNPQQVAAKFEYVHNVLKDIGFKYICRFSKMNPEFIKL